MNAEFRSPNRLCLLLTASLMLWLAGTVHSQTQTRIACIGEQTTHSFHRENDPEYPQFLGEILDKDFKIDTEKQHPNAGGFLYGGGRNYRIGNFGHPRGTVLDHELENPRAVIRSDELKLADQFAPNIVILGPFGDHESLTNVSMDKFTSDLRALIAHIASFKSKPVIFVVLPLPRGPKDEDANYQRIRNETEQVAREKKLPVIDLWTAFLGKPEYYKDATHLTVPGRHHLAEVVAAAITGWKTGVKTRRR
jgi:GDSL-like Lipase/Acylhydrolase family